MKRMKREKTTLKQQGFVSIIVAATVMILLSLITIGFTRVMQREQREALDRQLTRQATYAAESGINTVWQYIQNEGVEIEKNECSTDDNVFTLDNGTDINLNTGPGPAVNPIAYFDADDPDDAGVKITCVLYDKTPTVITHESAQNQEVIFPFEESDDENFLSLTISWSGEGQATYPASCSSGDSFVFPETHDGVPILKLDLYDTSSYSRDDLNNNASFLYLIPCDSGDSSITVMNQRDVYKHSIACIDGVCSVTLNVSALSTNSFFVRHKLLYTAGEVSLGGINASNEDAEIKRAQSIIDVTARSTDIVRRLRVHVPYNQAENIVGAVVTVGRGDETATTNYGLCKDISIIDGVRVTDNCD